MNRIALVAVALAALCGACGGAAVQSAPAADVPDAAVADAGAADAGPLAGEPPGDAGPVASEPADAGPIASGPADAGSPAPLPACSLVDAAPVWSIVGRHDEYGNGSVYEYVTSDSAGGAFVFRSSNAGQSSFTSWSTVSRDGALLASFDAEDCQAGRQCTSEAWSASGGFVAGSPGVIESPLDGRQLAAWDGALPPEASGNGFPFPWAVASDGTRVVFTLSDLWAGQNPRTLVTELDAAGHTVWQRVFEEGFNLSVALDGAGNTLLEFRQSVVGLDAAGQTLFTLPAPELAPGQLAAFVAGGGLLYQAQRTLSSTLDGTPSLTLPFEPHGAASLSASRILVRAFTGYADGLAQGPLRAVDPSSGAVLWERDLRPGDGDWAGFFSENGSYALVIDPQDVLHFVQQDGTDALACSLPPDVEGPGVLLPGGRLVVIQSGSLVAFDLPLQLEP